MWPTLCKARGDSSECSDQHSSWPNLTTSCRPWSHLRGAVDMQLSSEKVYCWKLVLCFLKTYERLVKSPFLGVSVSSSFSFALAFSDVAAKVELEPAEVNFGIQFLLKEWFLEPISVTGTQRCTHKEMLWKHGIVQRPQNELKVQFLGYLSNVSILNCSSEQDLFRKLTCDHLLCCKFHGSSLGGEIMVKWTWHWSGA